MKKPATGEIRLPKTQINIIFSMNRKIIDAILPKNITAPSRRPGKWIIPFVFLLLLSFGSMAQTDTLQRPEYFQTTMDSLLETQKELPSEEYVRVATQLNTPLRETPGIVTVITREDIESSGARDLVDLLRMVPGLEFGIDVQNLVGLGIRGNWAFEGKVLVTVDGQMINETAFGTYVFAQRMLTGNIEKIEIVRGPGSAIYGGIAGLAVINIITRTGKELNGFVGSSEIAFSNGRSRLNSQLALGDILPSGLSFNVAAGFSEANLSNRTVTEPNGAVRHFRDSSAVRSYFLTHGLQYKHLDVRYRFEDYKAGILKTGGQTHFGGHYLNVQYAIPVNSRLTLVPQLTYARQIPWNLLNIPDAVNLLVNRRLTGKIQLTYEPGPHLTLVSGIESFYDHSRITNTSTGSFKNGKRWMGYPNIAVYNQGVLKTTLANVTAGLRMDDHGAFGVAFSPRLGLTRVMNKWHLKLLYSNAFKAPTLSNLDANANLQPERIQVAEFEAGYQLNSAVSLTANLFDTKIKNTIVYEAIDDIIDHYRNAGYTGTRGGELNLRATYQRATLSANYACYLAVYHEVEEYRAPDHLHMNLGFPTHKATLQAGYKFNRYVSLHSSLLAWGRRDAFVPDAEDVPQLQHLPGALQADVYGQCNNVLYKGVHLAVGVYNVFNSNYSFVQPYAGQDRPVPAQSRELAIKLIFTSGQ
jgi:outer membrane cobalamin receptor